ncbi:MAG: RNA pseudouridine synthase [Vicingaceae bacterium]|nr:MAG: RNA pseudouridine synthase [Vicingaceae bacterium]
MKNISLKDRIIYEDNHLLVINKLPGELVQADAAGNTSLEDMLKEYIRHRDKKPGNVYLNAAHRIDRPVSGLVLFCKTSKSLARINVMLQSREIRKIYWAVVENTPPKPEDTLIHFLKRDGKKNKTYVFSHPTGNAKKAILHYKLLKKFERYSWLEIILETGRHHQIRAQLSAAGLPIKGDLKYGSKRSNKDGSICLHAASLEFIHPIKKERFYLEAIPLSEESIWNHCIPEKRYV